MINKQYGLFKVHHIMATYKIIATTNGYLANRKAMFNGHTAVTIESGLPLKEAQKKLLERFNGEYGKEYPNWGLVRRHYHNVSSSHQYGIRSFEYDSVTYAIKQETYIIRDREAGNDISEFCSLEAAQAELEHYEQIDRNEGTYTQDFYEIVRR